MHACARRYGSRLPNRTGVPSSTCIVSLFFSLRPAAVRHREGPGSYDRDQRRVNANFIRTITFSSWITLLPTGDIPGTGVTCATSLENDLFLLLEISSASWMAGRVRKAESFREYASLLLYLSLSKLKFRKFQLPISNMLNLQICSRKTGNWSTSSHRITLSR